MRKRIWFGSVPEEWAVVPMGRYARFCNGADYSAVEVDEPGYPVIGSGGQFRWAADYMFDGPSVLFGRKGTVDKPLFTEGKFWTVDTMYYTKVAQGHLLPRFLYYVALCLPFAYWKTDTALPSMTQADLSAVLIPMPPLGTQRAIVNFLDRETAEIDAFIADQERLIEMLSERRNAAIALAITKGISKKRAAASEVMGFGDVCSDWQVASIGKVALLTLGKMLDEGGLQDHDNQAFYLRAASVQPNGKLDLSTAKTMRFTNAELARLTVRQDDVVVVEGGVGGFGRAALITEDLPGWGFQNSIIRLRFNQRRYWPAFYAYVLLHLRSAGYIEMVSSAASMPHFTVEKVAATPVPVPPIAEQRVIAAHLNEITAQVELLIGEANEAINLSRERRAALISAAVTGKLPVPGTEEA